MIKTLIFDLDGTLLDTIEDIAATCNQVLKQYDYPSLDIKTYKQYVGLGVRKLIERLFDHYHIDPSLFDHFLSEYYRIYPKQSLVHTKIYEGIGALLQEAKAMGISVNVLSNKPHIQVQEIIPHYFKDQPFDLLYGKMDGLKAKPDPGLLLKMMEDLKVSKDQVLYIGDTRTDIETAMNAKLDSIGVLWGFRDRLELEKAGATFIVSNPKEIVDILKEKNKVD